MENRVVELEVKVAYLERAHDELSEVVRDLFEQVAGLKRQLDTVRDQSSVSSESPRSLEDDKPPHY